MRISDWSSDVCSSDLTAMAMYITPENIASIVSARASGESGTMSLRPTPDSVLKARKSVVEGKGVSVRVDLGGRRIIQQKIVETVSINKYKIMQVQHCINTKRRYTNDTNK